MTKHINGKSPRSYGDGGGVGYKNPPGPKWKKGQSGNPTGRRKGEPRRSFAEDLRIAFEAALQTKLSLPDGASMIVLDGVARRLCNDGLQNGRAGAKLFELLLDVDDRTARQVDPEADAVAPDDRAILEERLETLARRRAGGPADADLDGVDEA